MAKRKASDVFVECLEAEGVKHVFGIPGEETLDLNESLSKSSIEFIPVRHEQGGAYMADVYGRLTGHAGVCLGTLGPGALNLVTAVADAFLDRAPLVALTGQGDLERMHKESHQYIDLLRVMRPITKWNARLSRPGDHPRGRAQGVQARRGREAGRHAHRAARGRDGRARSTPRRCRAAARCARSRPRASCCSAADLIRGAITPVALAGNGVVRGERRAGAARVRARDRHPGRRDVHGQGPDPAATADKALGSVGLQSGDYNMAGFDEADVVLAIGYDLVEHSPEHWNPRRDKKIICIDSVPAEIDEYFIPEVELIGDIYHVLTRLGEECRHVPHQGGSTRLRDVVLGRFEQAKDDDAFPVQPPRALYEIRKALGREDILISDVGLHKLWIGRMFPAYEPNTVLIANGLAGMGFAVPAAVGAKLVHPDRNVVTVNGDGGFLMNARSWRPPCG